MSEFDSLIGKTIIGIFVGEAEQHLRFETDNGPVVFKTEADCCSETWFADIIGTDALFGGKVVGVDDMPDSNQPEGDTRGRQYSDIIYSHKIKTDKGIAEIIYRNSSNGYYGGSCSLAREEPKTTWLKITDDWRA